MTQNRRYKPGIRRAKMFLDSGGIGHITGLHADFFVGAHFGGFREEMAHVLLLDMAIHTFDAARFLSGQEPRSVFCQETNPVGSWYEDGASAYALFNMSGNVAFTYRGSWCAEGANTSWDSSWRITGSRGTLLWDGEEGFKARIAKPGADLLRDTQALSVASLEDHDTAQEHASVIAEFLLSIEENRRPETDSSDNLQSIAMVFQSYALYPHMTVMENLTYSQRIRKVNIKVAQQAATDIAKTIGLSDLLDRYPKELSGGQRQRVAMGRAIIRDPKVFLFDEPLSNLDASLRVKMRKEIRDLHERLSATTVYVTHDQIEAMTMADHVVVLRDGVIEQQDTPMNLYNKPASKFVAGFIGSPAMNFIDGTISEDGTSVTLLMKEPAVLSLHHKAEPGLDVTVGIRPEHIALSSATNIGLSLIIDAIETTGSMTYLTAGTSPALSLISTGQANYKVGESVSLTIEPENIHLFDKLSGKSLVSEA